MQQHKFILVFRLPNKHDDPRSYADVLIECRDSRPSFGMMGYLAIEFQRVGSTLTAAKQRAMQEVLQIIPGATLDVLERQQHARK